MGNAASITKRVSWGVIALVAALWLALIVSSPTFAQETADQKTSFAISPPIFEVSANPGDIIEQKVRVDNLTDTSLPLTLQKKDFVARGEEGQADLIDGESKYSLSNWIHLEKDSIDIPAKESQVVNFRIEVPTFAEPGGHFGSVVFQTEPSGEQNNPVSQRIGALVLLKVAGEAEEKANIASFTTDKTLFENGPVSFITRFQNEGNVQLKPTGTITINTIFGNKVASIDINSQTVLPDSIRRFESTWQDAAPGWYTATVSLNYGSKNATITSSTQFLVIPLKIVIPVVIVLVILAILMYRGRKRIKRSLKILLGKE